MYQTLGGIYINLTNRCQNRCTFCIRQNGESVNQHESLWLSHEPSACEVIAQLDDVLQVVQKQDVNATRKEIVFCGYGEPTYRLEVLLQVATYAKSKGLKVRLNTNGLGNTATQTDIVPLLKTHIDVVSISLNESNAVDYLALCKPHMGLSAFDHIITFATRCVAHNIPTVLSVVDVIAAHKIEECKTIAQQIGAELRVRKVEVS